MIRNNQEKEETENEEPDKPNPYGDFLDPTMVGEEENPQNPQQIKDTPRMTT